MKKILSAVAALMLISGGYIAAKGELVSIDSLAILQKSHEGKELATVIQKDIEKFQNEVKNSQQELTTLQESIAKQAKVLSKEAATEKAEELNNKRKQMERTFADKEEALRANIQRKQIQLRERQLVVVNEIFEKESWGAVIDKNTPGLLCVSNSIDRTDMVLVAVDQKYGSKAKKDVTAKPALNVKTVANSTPAPQPANKQTIKSA